MVVVDVVQLDLLVVVLQEFLEQLILVVVVVELV